MFRGASSLLCLLVLCATARAQFPTQFHAVLSGPVSSSGANGTIALDIRVDASQGGYAMTETVSINGQGSEAIEALMVGSNGPHKTCYGIINGHCYTLCNDSVACELAPTGCATCAFVNPFGPNPTPSGPCQTQVHSGVAFTGSFDSPAGPIPVMLCWDTSRNQPLFLKVSDPSGHGSALLTVTAFSAGPQPTFTPTTTNCKCPGELLHRRNFMFL